MGAYSKHRKASRLSDRALGAFRQAYNALSSANELLAVAREGHVNTAAHHDQCAEEARAHALNAQLERNTNKQTQERLANLIGVI